jgi:Protein of unknown function (DUF3515)
VLTGCSSHPSPVAVAPPTPVGGAATRCSQLVKALPATLEGQSRRATRPRSPLTHAWGKTAVVLRCGVPRPAGIAGAQIVIVNGVRWFKAPGRGSVTWTALRRPTYVALTIPTSYEDQGSFLVDLASPLKLALPLASRPAG